MTKILEIEDCSAASAWSPVKQYDNILALGTKDSGGAGFEETKGELALYDLNLAGCGPDETPTKLIGSVKTDTRFSTLAWTPGSGGDKHPMGLLAGGMENGVVHVWDPSAIVEGTDSLVATFSDHASGPVEALHFNALKPLQLATGGSDGKVLIYSLEAAGPAVMTPCDTTQQKSQITAVAWNSQVPHILASSAADGTVVVWDTTSRKAWCELRREAAGQAVSDIAWNPTQGLHLLTASADDHNPVIKLWDLRASTSMPLTTLSGHTQGILSMAWCPHDDHLLLSCARDNRTILWDLFSLRPVAEIPTDLDQNQLSQSKDGQDVFAQNGLASSKQMRYEVRWSPIKRGIVSTCALNRKVQAHSILGLSSKAGRPPKWMRPASCVSFGFGGSLVSAGATDKVARIRNIIEEKELVQTSQAFESTLQATEIMDYCIERASKSTDSVDAQIWAFMQVIFAPNARQQLLDNLGYDPAAIAEAVRSFVDAAQVDAAPSEQTSGGMSKATEDLVRKSLLVGNFEAAVECCFKSGQLADALILASCGGPELWSKVQQRYLETQSATKPFLSTVNAILHNQLSNMVQESDPKAWPETLAILSTYGKSDEFPQLCVALGELLETAGDSKSASLCYMCSLSLERSVKFWRAQLEAANKQNGSPDFLAMHDFVVRVSVFLGALGNQVGLEAADAEVFSSYANKLAEQGLLSTAAKYCRGENFSTLVLRDRLYRSRSSQRCLEAMNNQAPNFPFQFVEIHPSRVPTVLRSRNQHQPIDTATRSTTTENSSAVKQDMPTLAPDENSSTLPPGWMAIQDPASGHYYYANQSTGEVTWDKPMPQPVPAQQANVLPVVQETAQVQPQPAEVSHQSASTPSRTSKLASKYGDGFVTSSSHPGLASQYGNVGTSNPYSTSSRPGTAQVGSSVPTKAPVSANLDPDRIPELSSEYQPIKDCLLSLVEALKQVHLTAVDRRLLAEAEKAVAVLLKRLAREEVSADIGSKVVGMCTYVNSYDFTAAQSVHTTLVNSDWREHKDWLKGTKSLLQLATKKFS